MLAEVILLKSESFVHLIVYLYGELVNRGRRPHQVN